MNIKNQNFIHQLLIVGLCVSFSFLFKSCSSDFEITENMGESPEGNKTATSQSLYGGIYVPNGMTSNCDNNILYFASYEVYEEMRNTLENEVDLHEDSFIDQFSHLSEDDLNDMEESIGFNEDLPLDFFENENKFCSLRKVTLQAENAWLDTSDDKDFSWDDDPDDLPFIDGIERTFYNPWHEIIIADTLYKVTEFGYYSIGFSHPDVSNVLNYINREPSVTPETILQLFSSFVTFTTDEDSIDNQNCFKAKKRTERFVSNDGKYRIKARHKMKRYI